MSVNHDVEGGAGTNGWVCSGFRDDYRRLRSHGDSDTCSAGTAGGCFGNRKCVGAVVGRGDILDGGTLAVINSAVGTAPCIGDT